MQKRSIILFVMTLGLVVFTSACSPTPTATSPAISKRKVLTAGLGNPKQIKSYEQAYEQAGDLWQDMAKHFDLPDETPDNPRVKQQIDWYMSHPKYMQRAITRAQPYLYYIYQQVRARDLPAELALMPMIESAYNPFAINGGSGAAGLWQMMPGTATGFGLHLDWWYDGRRDVAASTNAALDYLAYLGNYFNGDWLLAMAAYDTGEGNIQQAIAHNSRLGKDTDFWDLRLARETQDYVPKILAFATILKHPDQYPLDLPSIKDAPYLAEVDVGGQIDLSHAAKMAGISLSQLSELNPGFNRWATDPNGPYKILLPVDHVEQFVDALNQTPTATVTWKRIKVTHGETLRTIAAHYNTTASMLQEVNHLHSIHLKTGSTILVPTKLVASGASNTSNSNDQNAQQSTTIDNTSLNDGKDDNSSVTNIVVDHEKVFLKDLNHIPEPDAIHYTVRDNDNIYMIARRYHVNSRDILFWNDLKSNDVTPGQDIIIWPSKRYKIEQSVKQTVSHYRVKAGDTLYHIAHRFGTTVEKLKSLNHLHSNSVTPGKTLVIPGKPVHVSEDDIATTPTHTAIHHSSSHAEHNDTHHEKLNHSTSHHNTTAKKEVAKKSSHYRVRPGDTVYKIARLRHVSPAELEKINHLNNHSHLKPGEEISIP